MFCCSWTNNRNYGTQNWLHINCKIIYTVLMGNSINPNNKLLHCKLTLYLLHLVTALPSTITMYIKESPKIKIFCFLAVYFF